MALYSVDPVTGDLHRVAGGLLYSEMPIGTIVSYGGSTAPTGYLLCNGAAVSRTTYAALFAAIGTAFGSGDGSTTFNVPDLREATTKGVGLTGKSTNHYDSDGVALGEFVEDRLQEHTHTYTIAGRSTAKTSYSNETTYLEYLSNSTTQANSGRSGNTTEVKAVGVNYIIKAVQSAVPLDIQSYVNEVVTYKVDDDYIISRSNKVVTIHCNGKTADQLIGNAAYFVPEDCRPTTRRTFLAYFRYSNVAYVGMPTIRTDGTISTYYIPSSYPHDNISAPGTGTLYFDYTYVI